MVPTETVNRIFSEIVPLTIADEFTRTTVKHARHYTFWRCYNAFDRDIVVRDVVQYIKAIGADKYPVTQYLINDVMHTTSREYPEEIERSYEWRGGMLNLYLDSKAIEPNRIFINMDAVWHEAKDRET